MASDNQLHARVRDRHIESIEDLAEKRGIRESEAQRVVVREGLTRLGYLQDDEQSDEVFLRYVRKSGMILGFVGLIAIGYGLFGTAAFRYIGFGLVLAGFAFIAGGEFAPEISQLIDRDADTTETA